MINKMSPLNRFLVLWLGVFISLTVVHQITPIAKAHFLFFRTFEQSIFNAFHPSVAIRLTSNPSQGAMGTDYDYSMNIYDKMKWQMAANKTSLSPSFIANNSSRSTYLGATILLLSLVIASPIKWGRKTYGILAGLLLLYILLALKFTFIIDTNGPKLTTGVSSLWLTISRLFGFAFRTNEFFLLLMIPVWALTCLNRQVYKTFIYG